MVQRYEVSPGQLASPVVGTPGVDPSAGKAAEAIGQMADQDRNQFNQAAMQRSQNSQQMFNNAAAGFANFSAQQNHKAMVQKAAQNEQNQLTAQLARLDEDSNIGDYVSGLQNKYSNNPQAAVDQFKTDLPQLQQQFQQRYSTNPQVLRMLNPSQRAGLIGAQDKMQTWATKTTTDNLNQRLQLLPTELNQDIGELSGPMSQQIPNFQMKVGGYSQVYSSLGAKAATQGTKDDIAQKQMTMQTDAGNAFVDHLIAGTPDGEDGLKHLQDLHAIVQNPKANGISLTPAAQENQLSKIAIQYKGRIDKVVTGIQGQNILKVMGATDLKNEIIKAANDPQQLATLAGHVQKNLQDLDGQRALVSKEPDGPIKNEKLTGIKQQQTALIGEAGQDLTLSRKYDQILRTITLDAQRQSDRAMRLEDRQMRLSDRQESISRRQLADQEKGLNQQADMMKIQRTGVWNADWANTNKDLTAAYALPAGAERQKAVHEIVNQALPKLEHALTSQAIGVDDYASHKEMLRKKMLEVSGSKTTNGFMGFGGGEVPLKAKAAAKAQLQADHAFGAIAAKAHTDFAYSEMAQQQLNSLTIHKNENVILTQKLSVGLPKMLGSKTFQAKSQAQQQADIANTVRNLVTHYRQGLLH